VLSSSASAQHHRREPVPRRHSLREIRQPGNDARRSAASSRVAQLRMLSERTRGDARKASDARLAKEAWTSSYAFASARSRKRRCGEDSGRFSRPTARTTPGDASPETHSGAAGATDDGAGRVVDLEQAPRHRTRRKKRPFTLRQDPLAQERDASRCPTLPSPWDGRGRVRFPSPTRAPILRPTS